MAAEEKTNDNTQRAENQPSPKNSSKESPKEASKESGKVVSETEPKAVADRNGSPGKGAVKPSGGKATVKIDDAEGDKAKAAETQKTTASPSQKPPLKETKKGSRETKKSPAVKAPGTSKAASGEATSVKLKGIGKGRSEKRLKAAGASGPPSGTAAKTFQLGTRPTGKTNGAKASETPEDKRRRLLREQKAQINDDLKKVARKIMVGGTVATFVALAGLYLMSRGGESSHSTLGTVLLVVGVVGFGVLGGIIYRMHASGKDAAIRRQQRRQSERARQDVHQFTAKLSAETRQKLLEVDARKKVVGDKTAEAMYIKLKADELSNALQFLCMTSRNGEFELNFDPDKGQGRLFLADGTVVFAQFGAFEGIEAIARMLKAGAADASFFEGRSAPGRNLEMPISGILLNASVMSDEMT